MSRNRIGLDLTSTGEVMQYVHRVRACYHHPRGINAPKIA